MKRFSYVSLCFCLFFGGSAFAVPLFGESAGTIKEGLLTLYRDDQNPNKVYFFPNATQFSVDKNKIPLFNFVYWGLANPSGDAGAYMTMTTHLTTSDSQQAALNNYMQNHPQMEVAVLPIKSSSVELSKDGDPSPALRDFFKEFDFPSHGGRAEDEIGVNASLTGRGAKVFFNELKGTAGGNILKLDYCYNIQGFGPSMNATISVNMRTVYDYFEAHASSRSFWHSVDIQTVVETLHRQNSIQITMNGGDATEWEVLNKVTDAIVQRLFTLNLQMTPVSAASGNRFYNFGVSTVKKEDLKEETWTFTRRDLEEREFCTAINLHDLDGFIDKLVVSAD